MPSSLNPTPFTIGGQPVITLSCPSIYATQPQFLSATVLPGKGMQLWQISAYLPKLGVVELLSAPNLLAAKQLLEDKQDPFGNNAFNFGSALLLPYANRIRGQLSPDGQCIATTVAGQKILLPANGAGAEKHAIHGLVHHCPFGQLRQQVKNSIASLDGLLHAGDFNGQWFSKTDVKVQIALSAAKINLQVTAKNVGSDPLPISIGAHPYFAVPSGDRKQLRLHLPAKQRAVVNNYQQVFTTGELALVTATPYDFNAKNGLALGKLSLDDSFTQLQRQADGALVITLIDPAANYGLRINALSAEIKAIQVYAPADKNFIAIEPQFNLADPYNKNWGSTDTGMVLLQPGQSVCWRLRLELFTPSSVD